MIRADNWQGLAAKGKISYGSRDKNRGIVQDQE